jgi:hypothetical protein
MAFYHKSFFISVGIIMDLLTFLIQNWEFSTAENINIFVFSKAVVLFCYNFVRFSQKFN